MVHEELRALLPYISLLHAATPPQCCSRLLPHHVTKCIRRIDAHLFAPAPRHAMHPSLSVSRCLEHTHIAFYGSPLPVVFAECVFCCCAGLHQWRRSPFKCVANTQTQTHTDTITNCHANIYHVCFMLCTFLLRTSVSVYLCPDCPTNMFPNFGDRPSYNVWRFW